MTGIVFYWTKGSLAYARSLFLTLCFANGFVLLYFPPTSCFMPSYTQTARESGGVRYAARPLRPTPTTSNTARTAVSALPAGKPPSVCGKSAAKLRSRGKKSLDLCGFTGTENARQGKDTYSRKNSVLLRNKIAENCTHTKTGRGAIHWLPRPVLFYSSTLLCRTTFLFTVSKRYIVNGIYQTATASRHIKMTPPIMPPTIKFRATIPTAPAMS